MKVLIYEPSLLPGRGEGFEVFCSPQRKQFGKWGMFNAIVLGGLKAAQSLMLMNIFFKEIWMLWNAFLLSELN